MGVNSIARTDKKRNVFSSFFGNVNHSWSQRLIKKALKGGADIRFLRE